MILQEVRPTTDVVEQNESDSEDTSFVSIADFFSLLSIAFIYFALVFGNPVAAPSAVRVESPAASGNGPAMPVDDTVANVSLLNSSKEGLVVRVLSPLGDRSDLYVRAINEPMTTVPDWVLGQLAMYKQVKFVVLYMDMDEVDVGSYKLRDRLGSALSQRFEVRVVFE